MGCALLEGSPKGLFSLDILSPFRKNELSTSCVLVRFTCRDKKTCPLQEKCMTKNIVKRSKDQKDVITFGGKALCFDG